jgi:hypothetical protein
MKRIVTMDDLTLLVNRASTLRKLAKSAQKIHADLAVEEGYVKAADKSLAAAAPLWETKSLPQSSVRKSRSNWSATNNFFIAPNWSTGKRTRRFQGWCHG